MDEGNIQCVYCGCSPCECSSLYPWCTTCCKLVGGYSNGEECPKCNTTLIPTKEKLNEYL